jgi:Fic-DOC domain mobile mystery protein B
VGPELTCPPGTTPLDPDEKAALIPRHIATQGQLNEWEHQNIVEGWQWAMRARSPDVLSIDFMRTLHARMLGATWQWAGALRTTEKNIGVAPEQITTDLRMLCDDVRYQIEHRTAPRAYPMREIAARFHHRLVYIHPFPNGNGRFARLLTDLLLMQQGEEPFKWGDGDLIGSGDVRTQYIDALRRADAGDYAPLLRFLNVK